METNHSIADPTRVKLKVKASNASAADDLVHFKVKITTKLEKLMEAYC